MSTSEVAHYLAPPARKRPRSTVMGTTSVVWLLGGGVIYSLGAVAYALKRPDPWPTVFGYHKVFHTLVVVEAACHFVTDTRVILGMAG